MHDRRHRVGTNLTSSTGASLHRSLAPPPTGGLRHPADLDAWQRWQLGRHPTRATVRFVRDRLKPPAATLVDVISPGDAACSSRSRPRTPASTVRSCRRFGTFLPNAQRSSVRSAGSRRAPTASTRVGPSAFHSCRPCWHRPLSSARATTPRSVPLRSPWPRIATRPTSSPNTGPSRPLRRRYRSRTTSLLDGGRRGILVGRSRGHRRDGRREPAVVGSRSGLHDSPDHRLRPTSTPDVYLGQGHAAEISRSRLVHAALTTCRSTVRSTARIPPSVISPRGSRSRRTNAQASPSTRLACRWWSWTHLSSASSPPACWRPRPEAATRGSTSRVLPHGWVSSGSVMP